MENASKALLMAAGVLMAIVIISLAVYLFVSFSTTSAELQDRIKQGQIDQFNNKFTSYQEKTDLTIYDIKTVVNLANDYNTQNGYSATESEYYISVYIGNVKVNDTIDDIGEFDEINNNYMHDTTDSFITTPYTTLIKYKCDSIALSTTTGRVKEIKFTKIN